MTTKQYKYTLELSWNDIEEGGTLARFETKPEAEVIRKIIKHQLNLELPDDELEWFISPDRPGCWTCISQDGYSLYFSYLDEPMTVFEVEFN